LKNHLRFSSKSQLTESNWRSTVESRSQAPKTIIGLTT
jgi:hypothetical protein